ncbi:hypothetical protein LTR62_007362 [Meristemomyces frigidus]|uniref:Uncharacterized protein n=1 Tax=Meristemomyces frigidus TaxID=1508187 RepID=A0AAN7YIW0_9PEZI|nr:hypothetical protein LTR62_007362 [Meristemomyces frigidus]
MGIPAETFNVKTVACGPTFVFKDRSKEALRNMYIIKRTPSPPPLEERFLSSLRRCELREMQKQLKARKGQQAAAVQIKRERSDDNPRPRKGARPSPESTLLEILDDDTVREAWTAALPPKVVIELD